MKHLLLALSALVIFNLSQAQERSFNLSLQTELGALAGAKAEVYQEKEVVASLISDAQGKLSIHLNVFPGTEITVVLQQPMCKRYLIDLQELDKDYNYNLKMTALSMNEKKRIEAAEKGDAELSSNYASIFLKYDKQVDSIISLSSASFEAGRKMKISPFIMVAPAAAAAAKKTSSSEVFKAREAEYKAEQAVKDAEQAKRDAASDQKKQEQKFDDQKEKSEKEAKKNEKELAKQQKEQDEREKELKKAEKQQKKEQKALNKEAKAQAKAAKKTEKWEKKMASYNKKLANYNKDKVKIDKSQRKLDKKIRKEKVDAEKAASIQKSIDEDRKSLEKRIQDLEQRIKKHRKSSPYGN